MRIFRYILPFLVTLSLMPSCKEIETLPPIPRIEFRQFEIFDTTDILGNVAKGGRLKFYFEDGDGDLGLKAPIGNDQDTANLFLTLYRKVNGQMVLAPENDPLEPSDYRIPYMDRLGQNKILKGTISVTFIYLFAAPGDTIMYDFFIEDRKKHESNIASTTDIVVLENNIYK
jgi:hypothetical protein